MKYFSIKELSKTNTGIPNPINKEQIRNLHLLVEHVLDPLREAMQCPIYITSGYRSPQVNRAVGGARLSQHILGQAVDFVCQDNAKAFHYIRQNLPYDQLIWEYGNHIQPKWVHVSFHLGNNDRVTLRCLEKGKYTLFD